MSATKIAASLRVSLTALAPKQADRRVLVARAWLHYHAALRKTWKQGMQAPRIDRPVYPRHVDHNTVTGGGIADEPTQIVTWKLPIPDHEMLQNGPCELTIPPKYAMLSSA
jgi:hypothetical protein